MNKTQSPESIQNERIKEKERTDWERRMDEVLERQSKINVLRPAGSRKYKNMDRNRTRRI